MTDPSTELPRAPRSILAAFHFGRRALTDTLSGRKALMAARPETTDHDKHLMAGADWLRRSISVCGGQASSKAYRFPWGWTPPYPETTGYIIPTLLNLSDETGDPQWQQMATRMGQWLTTIQGQDGGFAGYELGSGHKADVFDTGMILLGFNALQLQGTDPRIAAASARAAAFLQGSLDEQGAFLRNVSHDMLHTYNVRAAWSLVAYGAIAGDTAATSAGLANVDWTLRQQRENGFFDNNAFKPGGNANTHGIAYVLRGLLQVHFLTGRQDILAAVTRGADAVVGRFQTEGWLAAEIGPDWGFRSSHVCLTGCVQIAIICLRLGALTGDRKYIHAAEHLIAQVAATQSVQDPGQQYHGAISGSYPIYGAYAPLQYPNWATKFLVDALILRRKWHRGERTVSPRDMHAG